MSDSSSSKRIVTVPYDTIQIATERAAPEQLKCTHEVDTFSSSPAEASVPSEREQSLEAPRQAQQALESFTRTEPLALSALDAAALSERVALDRARGGGECCALAAAAARAACRRKCARGGTRERDSGREERVARGARERDARAASSRDARRVRAPPSHRLGARRERVLQPALTSTQHAEHASHSLDAPSAERDDVLEASLQ